MISFKRSFPWISLGSAKKQSPNHAPNEPLREFVYLDEVSLASLLASQKGEATENVTAQSQDQLVAEVASKLGAKAPLLPSAEVNSRFQTTNSSTLQTVRKANAQSLFRELHQLTYLRRIQPLDDIVSAKSLLELFDGSHASSVFKSSDLQRGDLVEFRVKLSASWIFQISTMVAEFSDMFDESPALFVEHVRFTDLYDAKNANRIISKLLAGLVPIDGLVSDYSIVQYQGEEYVIHNTAMEGLGLERLPLQIVGVTDHMAYWKDIRRILFAENEFTLLCRIAKSGVQNNWNPIKLADVFKDFAPDLAKQIEESSKIAMIQSLEKPKQEFIEPNLMRFLTGLTRYKELLLERISPSTAHDAARDIDRAISEMKVYAGSAEGQRAAFGEVKSVVEKATGKTFDPAEDLRLREQVRGEFSLPLFPAVSTKQDSNPGSQHKGLEPSLQRLLDVEVVAIYW